MTGPKERVLGLDVARASAIALVMLAHFSLFFNGLSLGGHTIIVSPALYGFGYLGVEIFFALSGFLVGQIAIRTVSSDFGSLKKFWIRRWARTLPMYYFVLVLLVLVDYWHHGLHWSTWFWYPFFLQNLGLRLWTGEGIFGVSWSLVIEEWFYLLLPLAIYFVGARFGVKAGIVKLCVGGIALCLLARIGYVLIGDPDWQAVRMSTFIHMDALLFGVLAGAAKLKHPVLYEKWTRRPRLLMVLGAFGLGFSLVPFFDMSRLDDLKTVFIRTGLFTVTSLSATVLVIGLAAGLPGSDFRSFAARTARFVSITSYSAYLMHWEWLQFGLRYSNGSLSRAIALFVAVIAATLLASYVTYRAIELPGMRLREKLI